MRVRAIRVANATDTASAPRTRLRSRHLHSTLQLVGDLLALFLIFTLDLFDIYFKTQWIGPQDTFSFTAIGTQVLQQQPLVPVSNVTTPGARDERLSGWSSFLEKCDSLRPIGGNFFLHAMGENCRFGPSSANVSVPKIMFVSSLRVDSVAWAACKLLRVDRRPVVCRSSMVEDFHPHYNMAETPLLLAYPSRDAKTTTTVAVSRDEDSWTSDPGSAAETEVLELLTVIGESAPLGHVVCVEGFVFQGPGRYVSSIFGCGSPNRYHSAFVGIHASAMAQFHQNKAWLTSDWLYLFGVPLLIRQNCLSLFNVIVGSDQSVTLVHQTMMNYCSSGGVYYLVIAIDAFVLVVNVMSSIEVASSIPWHQMVSRGNAVHPSSSAQHLALDYHDVLTRRMLRSPTFSLLMLLSQSLSWTVVLANSLIWTWTEALWGRVRSFLSTLRFWMIVLIATNAIWNVVVSVSERRAYAVVRRTFVAMYEVLVVSTVVAFFARDRLFHMSGDKYAIEGQRRTDATAFHGVLAFANAFPEWLDTTRTTPLRIFWIIYRPLLCLVGSSLGGILLIIVWRFLWHLWHHGTTTTTTTKETRVRPLGPTRSSLFDSMRIVHEMTTAAITPAPYERLEIERVVSQPLRARSLVRSSHAMEVECETQRRRLLRVATLVDHGILYDGERGVLRGRRGFLGVLSGVERVASHGEPSRDLYGGAGHPVPVLQALH